MHRPPPFILLEARDHLIIVCSMVAESVVEFSYGRHTDEVGNDYLERLYRIQEMIVKASFGYVVDLAPFRTSNSFHGRS